jgi:prolyl oligopeptidase
VIYPTARTSEIVDTLHGVDVPDPYRWLEGAEHQETLAWVTAQNALTRSFLDDEHRQTLVTQLTELFNYPRSGAPLRRGGRYFFTHNSGLQPQAVLFVQNGASGVPRVLIDPNTLSADGTVALTAVEPSVNGALIAYAMSRGGSDRQEIRIRDVETGSDLPDCLQWVKFASIAWSLEPSGFYYLRFPEPGTVPPEDEQYFGRIHFHRLGDAQSEDVLVFEIPEQKEVVPVVDTTPDGRFVVITAQRGASDDSEIYVIDLAAHPQTAPQPLFHGFDAAYAFIDAADGRLFFRTTRGAPRGRIIAVDAHNPATPIEEIVSEASDRLSSAVLARGTIVASYLHNASDRIRLFDLHGRNVGEIDLPGIGSLASLDAQPDARDVLFTFTSFTHPPAAYRCKVPGGAAVRFGLAGERGAHAFEGYETQQVWYPSKDGTRVSMFLVHRQDLPRDGNRPVLLNGYGGFNISRTPAFDPGILPILDRGGVFALANLRGGGEYGEDWHRAGMLERKQNVFDDFIAAAEYLTAERYTNPRRLAIEGGSNGGLLVGAVMVQRPELFGAVICRVPVADMLRYHLFTVGRFWIPEYGSADDPDQFRVLLSYSPYHNVRTDGIYPPVLVMTADTDDRVSPGMAKKFAARLQAAGRGGPFLIRVETRAGHGAGKPVAKLIEEDADILAFLDRTSWKTEQGESERDGVERHPK